MARSQNDLPEMTGKGVEAPQIKDMDNAFEALISARTKRMSWADKEREAQTSLIALFHKHELTAYNFDDKTYILKDIEKVVVKPKDEVEE